MVRRLRVCASRILQGDIWYSIRILIYRRFAIVLYMYIGANMEERVGGLRKIINVISLINVEVAYLFLRKLYNADLYNDSIRENLIIR